MKKRDKTWTAGGASDSLELMHLGNHRAQKAAPYGATAMLTKYRTDPIYGRVERAVANILATGKVVTPIEVLVSMDILALDKLEDWYAGRVPYLEKVINCNLTSLARLLRILRFLAHDLNLVPSATLYTRTGKGPRHQLRFTKTGDPKIEEAYARHFIWPGKGPFHPPLLKKPPE